MCLLTFLFDLWVICHTYKLATFLSFSLISFWWLTCHPVVGNRALIRLDLWISVVALHQFFHHLTALRSLLTFLDTSPRTLSLATLVQLTQCHVVEELRFSVHPVNADTRNVRRRRLQIWDCRLHLGKDFDTARALTLCRMSRHITLHCSFKMRL